MLLSFGRGVASGLRSVVAISACMLTVSACAGLGAKPVSEIHSSLDWANLDGAEIAKWYQWEVRQRLLARKSMIAHTELLDAGYECITGEASEDYPDPSRLCTKSFAPRACQMKWEVFMSPERGRIYSVDAVFERDCVGTDRDWPHPVRSAIDDQLAAPPKLQ